MKVKTLKTIIYLLYAIGNSKHGPGHHSKSAVGEDFDVKVFSYPRVEFHTLKNKDLDLK